MTEPSAFAGTGLSVTNRRFTRVDTPLGELLVAVGDEGIYGAYFDGQQHQPEASWFGPEARAGTDDSLLTGARRELQEYFDGDRTEFTLPLAPIGTAFQRSVWAQLLDIPCGTTTTYGALARQLTPPSEVATGLAQGVGQAVGRNPITVIVPCHRVVGSDGSLTGYAGGLDRKRWLLAHEEPEDARTDRLF